jgi:hypothetical protein
MYIKLICIKDSWLNGLDKNKSYTTSIHYNCNWDKFCRENKLVFILELSKWISIDFFKEPSEIRNNKIDDILL